MLTQIPQLSPPTNLATPLHTNHSPTTDFGIQVDLPPEADGLTCEERRRLKKRQSRKRRRQRSAESQREARQQIAAIIDSFYEGSSTFEDHAQRLQTLVEVVYNNDFRDFLDQLIRLRVGVIQKSIWEYTQQVLQDRHFDREDLSFYFLMADHLYSVYSDLQSSSAEIEKVINVYLRYAYQKEDGREEIVYNNLAVNTFNYMVETDDTLKNLIRICDRKIGFTRSQVRNKLQQLISVIDCYYDDEQGESECLQDELQSTGHSEEEEQEEKKKRRKKVKESDLTSEESTLMKRLADMVIRIDQRSECRVSESDRQHWQDRLQQYRRSK